MTVESKRIIERVSFDNDNDYTVSKCNESIRRFGKDRGPTKKLGDPEVAVMLVYAANAKKKTMNIPKTCEEVDFTMMLRKTSISSCFRMNALLISLGRDGWAVVVLLLHSAILQIQQRGCTFFCWSKDILEQRTYVGSISGINSSVCQCQLLCAIGFLDSKRRPRLENSAAVHDEKVSVVHALLSQATSF